MAKSLDEIYAENYLGIKSNTDDQGDRRIIRESVEDLTDENEDFESPKPRKKKKSKFDAGKHYAEAQSFNKLYSNFMEQFENDDDGFDMNNSMEGDDTTFDFDEQDDSFGGDEQSFSLSELRSMTLGELVDLLASGDSDESFDDFDDDDFDDDDFDDDVPLESFTQMNGGSHTGANGNYSGKAGRQSATSHVKSNGDADFSKQYTGFDPEDTEGSEGSSEGDGDYSGKAKRQPPTDHVKSNGDMIRSQKTGYRIKSGKKEKNFF